MREVITQAAEQEGADNLTPNVSDEFRNRKLAQARAYAELKLTELKRTSVAILGVPET